MIPHKIKLQGSLGILAAMGRDEIVIDLDALVPDDAVTVAIRGDNGSGKSTLLNLAMTPWRNPDVLGGTLYEEFGDKGLRELEFSHNGGRYLSSIQIRQTKKTSTMKPTLHKRVADKWEPVSLPDGTTSDGKSSTYDECLEYVLGPESIYYLSAFRGQGAAKLAEYDDPKAFMRDLLSLDKQEALRKRATEVIAGLNREYVHYSAAHEAAEALEEELEQQGVRLGDLKADEDKLEEAVLAANEALIIAEADHKAAANTDVELLRARKAREDAENALNEDRKNAVRIESELTRGLDSILIQIGAAHDDKAEKLTRLARTISDINLRKDGAEKVLADKETYEEAARQADDRLGDITAAEVGLSNIDRELEQFVTLSKQIADVSADLRGTEQAGKHEAATLVTLKKRAELVSQATCKGEGKYAQCPLIVDAVEAGKQIAGVEEKIRQVRGSWKQVNAYLRSLREKEVGKEPFIIDRKLIIEKIVQLRDEVAELKATASKMMLVEQAEQTIKDADESLIQADKDSEAIEDRFKQLVEKLEVDRAAQEELIAETQEANRQKIEELQEAFDALPEPDVDNPLAVSRKMLEQATWHQKTAVDGRNKNREQANLCKIRIDTIRDQIANNAEQTKKAKHLKGELAHWKLLATGLKGVIDLSIEDAGPAIAATANKLLKDSFGPRFSMRIRSQRIQGNGKVVEDFDIMVMDGESGIESPLLKKSGGQQVWMDKALTDATGIYYQQASGVHPECLFADEAEDGLTAERKNQYYRMDRFALEDGGYQRKYFVSHHQDAWAYADHVIDMVDL